MLKIFFSALLLYINQVQGAVFELHDVIRVTRENNLAIIAAKEKIQELESQKSLGTSSLFPQLTWALEGAYQKDAVYNGAPRFAGEPYNQYRSDLEINQILFKKGTLSRLKSIAYDKKIQEVALERIERELTKEIIRAFYKFILDQQKLGNLLKNQEIIQKSLTTSQRRYEMGRGELLDILQAKTQLALIQPKIALVQNEFEADGLKIINLMGLKEHPELKIKGELKKLLYRDVEKLIDLKNFRFPEYESNQLLLEQLRFDREASLGEHFPKVELVGNYLYNNYKKADLYSDFSNSWGIKLQVNIPLFSGLSSMHERSILSSQDSQLRIQRRELENTLGLEQMVGLKNLKSAEVSLVTFESAVKLAVQAQDEASRLYRLSQIDFLQFLSVQQAALEAKSSLDLLKYQSIVAYADYFTATGQSLDVLVSILSGVRP